MMGGGIHDWLIRRRSHTSDLVPPHVDAIAMEGISCEGRTVLVKEAGLIGRFEEVWGRRGWRLEADFVHLVSLCWAARKKIRD